MSETKERILNVSLSLFSEKGYSAVSIRDICKEVEIKESSIYYHFKNKHAIFEELLSRFQNKADSMMGHLASQLAGETEPLGDNFYMVACNHFFEHYLMDEFCNKIIRLMLIEQFNNEEVKKVYDHWMFVEPLKFQSSVFQMLMEMGIIVKADSEYMAIKYYAPIFFFAQKWLFCGKLSEENKESFRKDAYKHIQLFFSEMEGA